MVWPAIAMAAIPAVTSLLGSKGGKSSAQGIPTDMTTTTAPPEALGGYAPLQHGIDMAQQTFQPQNAYQPGQGNPFGDFLNLQGGPPGGFQPPPPPGQMGGKSEGIQQIMQHLQQSGGFLQDYPQAQERIGQSVRGTLPDLTFGQGGI